VTCECVQYAAYSYERNWTERQDPQLRRRETLRQAEREATAHAGTGCRPRQTQDTGPRGTDQPQTTGATPARQDRRSLKSPLPH